MNEDEFIDLYLRLTDTIHNYWIGFGALTALIIGWLLSRESQLTLSQRISLTIGWFGAAGYLGSSLMNRYGLVTALTQDMQKLNTGSELVRAITKLGRIYQHYETIVWSSFGFISLGALTLIWSNVTLRDRR